MSFISLLQFEMKTINRAISMHKKQSPYDSYEYLKKGALFIELDFGI